MCIYTYIYLKKKSGIAAHNMHDIMKNIFAIRVESEGNISILYKISKIWKLTLPIGIYVM